MKIKYEVPNYLMDRALKGISQERVMYLQEFIKQLVDKSVELNWSMGELYEHLLAKEWDDLAEREFCLRAIVWDLKSPMSESLKKLTK